ncbi:MAG: hypothetical protein AAFP90_17995 [Planctomycetota bacterium]
MAKKPRAGNPDENHPAKNAGAARTVHRNDGSGTFCIVDGRIESVVRKSESRWFEITNVEMFDAGDNTILPAVTTVSYRDPKTGNLT